VSLPAAGAEIKQTTKHVEAAIRVVSGRGFNSPRLHWGGGVKAVAGKNAGKNA